MIICSSTTTLEDVDETIIVDSRDGASSDIGEFDLPVEKRDIEDPLLSVGGLARKNPSKKLHFLSELAAAAGRHGHGIV